MDCHQIQELILESLDTRPASEMRQRIDAHVRGCVSCSRFAQAQEALDDRLSALLAPAPAIAQTSRAALRARIRVEAPPVRRDTLPEIVHFGSFAVATLIMILILPLSPSIVGAMGVTLALVSYVLLSVVRDSFDASVLGADA